MILIGYTATALSRNDIEDTPTNKNVVDFAIVELKDLQGNLVVMYDDAEGTNPETQKVCDTNGQVDFFAEVGDYDLEINGKAQRINLAANIADYIKLGTGESVQDFADSFALKIFQSPTDGGLTEIQTRTVDAGEVYEVRKTSDNSLAAIYSDAAGTTEIVQNGTSNVSDSAGVVEFYIADGDYTIAVGAVSVGLSVDKRTIFVGSVAENASGLTVKDGQSYLVNGWHSLSNVGGGLFTGRASVLKSQHNGGTIISPTVPPVSAQAGATLSDKVANFLLGEGESDPTGSGCFVRQNRDVEAPMFGTKSEPGHDDSWSLQALFDYYETSEQGEFLCDWSGRYYIQKAVNILKAAGEYVGGSLIVESDITGPVVSIGFGFQRGRVSGIISVEGPSFYTDRLFDYGVFVTGPTTSAFIEQINVKGARRFGVDLDAIAPNGVISTTIGKVNWDNCGSCPQVSERRQDIEFSGRTDSGGANNQLTKLTLTDPSQIADIEQYDCVLFDGLPYQIMALDANTVGIYPWIDNLATTAGTLTSIHGGGVRINDGGNSTGAGVDSVRGLFGGFGVWFSGTYGGSISSVVSEFCGAGLAFGRKFSGGASAIIGAHVGHTHLEVCEIPVFKIGSPKDITISSSSYLFIDQCRGLGWRTAEGERSPVGERFDNGLKIITDTYYKKAIGNESPGTLPMNNEGFYSNATLPATIDLKVDEAAFRLYGARVQKSLIMGTPGSNFETRQVINVRVDDDDFANGYSVMSPDNQTFQIPNIYSETYVVCTLVNKVWAVSYTAGTRTQPLIAAPTGGTTVDTEARAAINTIIAALKANGLIER